LFLLSGETGSVETLEDLLHKFLQEQFGPKPGSK